MENLKEIITLYYSIAAVCKGQISEADEDWAAFPCEMLQVFLFKSACRN
jgi:hypothetical protein